MSWSHVAGEVEIGAEIEIDEALNEIDEANIETGHCLQESTRS